MSKLSRKYLLNTGLAAHEPDGEVSDETVKELAMPVRARIMQLDGVISCTVLQYTIEVFFLDHVTDEKTVKNEVKLAVAWASEQPWYFPLRGDKPPDATWEFEGRDVKDPSEPHWVYVSLSSEVVAFPVSAASDGWDEPTFRSSVHELATALVRTTGVRDYKLRRASASLSYDPTVTTYETIVAHMQRVFRATAETATQDGSVYFPYLGINELEMTFESE